LVFDWDGTAVQDGRAGASDLRRLIERLTHMGFDIAIVSGTNVDNVDSQLAARPEGPGRLHLCVNRGSEVFRVGLDGPVLLQRRVASPEEDDALTAAARLTASRLAKHGLRVEIVSGRLLNQRKIDLIPEPDWADPPKARIAELLTAVEARLHTCGLAGLAEVAERAQVAAIEAGLSDPRVTSDVKHVEIGLTDKSDAARWVFDELARCGLGPGSVLVAGDEFGPIGGLPGSDSLLLVDTAAGATAVSVGAEPNGVPDGVVALGGGPDAFLRMLREQLRRREHGELPVVAPDPAWTLEIQGLDPMLERAHEALLTLADGRVGTAGAPLLAHGASNPWVVIGGVYDGTGADSRLLEGPRWAHLPGELDPPEALRRILDLRAGLLYEQSRVASRAAVKSVRFSSASRPGTVALRAETTDPVVVDQPLAPPRARAKARRGMYRGRAWLRVEGSHGGVCAAARDTVRSRRRIARLERLAAYVGNPETAPSPEHALEALLAAESAGFERLLHEHRAAWGARWEGTDVRLEGDPELQRGLRFALFQLMSSVAAEGETALGARGLSGPGYRGHVFWDTDVFVLPLFAATWPQAARTLLEYRLRRLRAARTEARRAGRRGARFPWESARSGRDATPSRARLHGQVVPIWTGELEEHVVADVAWAAACYIDWTGDEEFAAGPGLTLFLETARYWASRIRLDVDGRGHIDGVIGPDEYHERVDDNAFTNVMARWNLRRAAEAAANAGGRDVEDGEPARWTALADALVDGYDANTGLYEQFAGFSELEPLVIEEIAPRRPVAAELLLGLERVRGAQVVKQADVLMLHHLVPDEVAPGSLRPNLLFYEPRTAHGSSLSPGIHAALFAQAGMLDEALELLRLTSRIDLDDLTDTTANGLHLAAMGSLWQALAFGFMGMRPDRDALRLAPRLPREWRGLEQRVRFRGAQMTIRVEQDTLFLTADPPTPVLVEGRKSAVVATPTRLRLERHGRSWREVPR
jgi:trehalose/maltose hydrolase-like predicted phosphorylase